MASGVDWSPLRMQVKNCVRRAAVAAGLHGPWYAWRAALGRRRLCAAEDVPDLVMILNEDCRGWILEGICREIQRYFPGRVEYCFYPERIPNGRAYFVTQYTFLAAYVKANPALLAARTVVWYTHPSDLGIPLREFIDLMNRAHHIVPTNSAYARDLAAMGVDSRRITCVLGGADPELFRGHPRGNGAVGICSLFYPRKNGDLILEVARRLPDRRFLLVGRNWEQWDRFGELTALPNFEYVTRPYSEYPALYAKMDIFLSPSKVEGGPIPLIEAMMSNAVPVATRTGFAPDIIRDGENGFLFGADAGAEEVSALVERAARLQTDVRATVAHLSWESFSRQMVGLLG